MILPFLPEGAHAILINYMAAERGSKRGLRGGGGAAAGAADGATNDDRRLLQMPPDRHDDDDDDAEPPGRRAAEGGGGGGKRGSKGHNKGQKGQKRGVRIVSSSCGPTRGPWRTQSSGTLPRRASAEATRPPGHTSSPQDAQPPPPLPTPDVVAEGDTDDPSDSVRPPRGPPCFRTACTRRPRR